MKLFSKNKKASGHMAVCLHADGIFSASVKRSDKGLPNIEWINFVPLKTSSAIDDMLEALAKNADADRYTCSNLLVKDEYQLSLLDAPNTPQSEWKAAIRWQLRDVLDYSVTDATVDVIRIPSEEDGIGQTPSVYAVAARNKLIKERQDLFGAAKMPLTVIDIPEMAQRNIASLLEPSERALALLSFDAQGGLLTISYSGELYLARRIEISTLQLLHSREEKKSELYERLTVDLQRTLDHFERQFRHIVLGKMVLGPMEGLAADMQSYLSSGLQVPVETLSLDRIFNIDSVPELKQADAQQRYFLTLGAALRPEEAAA